MLSEPSAPAQAAAQRPRTVLLRKELVVPFAVGEVHLRRFLVVAPDGGSARSRRSRRSRLRSTAHYLVAEGRPTPLVSKLHALYYKVDTPDVLPLRSADPLQRRRQRHRTKTTLFDHAKQRAELRWKRGRW
jgi:hypothetical protein